jgi:hypothetical protein
VKRLLSRVAYCSPVLLLESNSLHRRVRQSGYQIIFTLDGRMSEDEDEDEEQKLRRAEQNALPRNLIHRVRISSCAAVKIGFSTVTNALILLSAFALTQFVHAASSVNKVCIRIRCRAREVCYAPHPVP